MKKHKHLFDFDLMSKLYHYYTLQKRRILQEDHFVPVFWSTMGSLAKITKNIGNDED